MKLHHLRRASASTQKRVTLGLAAAMTVVALAGCSAGAPASTSSATASAAPVAGGTMKVALAALPAILDPYATSLQANWIIARQVCEPLFDVSNQFEVKPVLASKYSYDGKLSYVITLRSGVTFQDGEPFTAKDVVSSLTRYYGTPGNGSILKGLVKTAVATDTHTVTITLNSPSLLVPTLLTTAFMMPASIQDGLPATTPVSKLVCTGPYTVDQNVPGQTISIKKWSGYSSPSGASNGGTGAKHAFLDEIDFTQIPTDSTRIQAVETGLSDLAIGTLDDNQSASTNSAVTATVLAKSISPAVIFNKVSGPMANVKMRQAFQAALNMTDIMAAGFGDPSNYEVDGSIFSSVNKVWHTEAGTKGAYNVHDAAKVKSLLKQAGYNGEKIVWYTTQDDPNWYGPSVPSQQELKKLGFNIDLQVVDQATIIARRTDPSKYDIFSSGIPTYADPVLLPYLQQTFPGTWTSAERDSLLQTLSTASTQAERSKAWASLQTLIYQDVPFIKFGTVAGGTIVTNPKVHSVDGLSYAGSGLFFNYWMSK
jgi:peptide/nickel transport system substrate-binding protein